MSGGSASEESGDYSGYYAQPDNEGYAYHDPYDNSDYRDPSGGSGGNYIPDPDAGMSSQDFINEYLNSQGGAAAAPPPVAAPEAPAPDPLAGNMPGEMNSSAPAGQMSDPTGGMSDAFAYLKSLFDGYGLGSLAPMIQQYVQAGYSGDTISLMLQDTAAYKQRFAGNDTRQKQGLPRLAPAQYLQMEDEYKGLFRQYGLPTGMYDSQDDFVTYIGNDVSPQEMDSRLQIAQQTIRADNPEVRDTYKAWYANGLSEGDAIAAVLDPGRALPELERKQRAAAAGGAASFYGLQTDQNRAEYLAGQGVSSTEAMQGYQQVAGLYGGTKSIADMYGLDYSQTDAENEAFFGDDSAKQKRRQVNEREIADFSGGQIANSKSFGAARY